MTSNGNTSGRKVVARIVDSYVHFIDSRRGE
jgi:hypothetical protein